jgi:hypothetical protein
LKKKKMKNVCTIIPAFNEHMICAATFCVVSFPGLPVLGAEHNFAVSARALKIFEVCWILWEIKTESPGVSERDTQIQKASEHPERKECEI